MSGLLLSRFRKIIRSGYARVFRSGDGRSRFADAGRSAEEIENDRRKDVGVRGEEAVARLLLKTGYRILERNYLCRSGEIDIIAEKGDCIVFVEVKTRSPRSWEMPEEAVTPEKQRRIQRAARHYMMGFSNVSPVRYDSASVYMDGNGQINRIEIREAAFAAEVQESESFITP